MHDYLIWPRDSRDYRGVNVAGLYGIRGYGFYEEECRRFKGRCRISAMRLVRTQDRPCWGGEQLQTPMPSMIAADPDWIPDA